MRVQETSRKRRAHVQAQPGNLIHSLIVGWPIRQHPAARAYGVLGGTPSAITINLSAVPVKSITTLQFHSHSTYNFCLHRSPHVISSFILISASLPLKPRSFIPHASFSVKEHGNDVLQRFKRPRGAAHGIL